MGAPLPLRPQRKRRHPEPAGNHFRRAGLVIKRDIAETISKLMLEYGAKLDDSVRLVMDNCPAEDFHAYRLAVGKIMGEMLTEVMNPLYREHPDSQTARPVASAAGEARQDVSAS